MEEGTAEHLPDWDISPVSPRRVVELVGLGHIGTAFAQT